MSVVLQLYEQWFEEKCLSETGDFYRQEARKLLDEYNCSEYMERVRLYVVCSPLCYVFMSALRVHRHGFSVY